MAAPPADLLTALRAGTVARHLFFRMTHSAGDVLAWDGIGEFALSGYTYLGIHDAAEITGVSASSDLQSNAVNVTLNGVPRSAVRASGSVRDQTATITAAWITEAGVVLASRVVFAGLADSLRSKINGESVSLSIRVRAKLADWAKAPVAYYTPRDQQRVYPTDTGFQFVKDIQAGSTAGWSLTEEVTTARALIVALGFPNNDLTGEVIGSNLYGPNTRYNVTTGELSAGLFSASTVAITEETTGATVAVPTSGAMYVKVGGSDCYIDVSGDLRSPGGNLIIGNATTTERMRQQTAITTVGASTADYVGEVTISGSKYYTKNGVAAGSTRDLSQMVYCNRGAIGFQRYAGAALFPTLFEDTTATAVTVSGGGRLQVGGADCTVSANGCIRSPAGNYIVPTGYLAADGYFLRIWA